jgi:hypothetical protein
VPSDGDDPNVSKARGELPDVVRVMCGHDGWPELDCRCHDESVDRMGAGTLGLREECASTPRDARRKWSDDNPAFGKHVIDRRVSGAATADLGKDRRWHTDECMLLVSDGKDRASPEREGWSFPDSSQCVERFGVED